MQEHDDEEANVDTLESNLSRNTEGPLKQRVMNHSRKFIAT